MDDFEYSVHISDQDWDSFFQECERCDVLSPDLASREDSGMSDIDEFGCHCLDKSRILGSEFRAVDPDHQIDGPPDCEGSPVTDFLSKYGICSPEQVLSGSEDDLQLQTVNLFFEQLKSVAVNERPVKESCALNWPCEETSCPEGLIDKQDVWPEDVCPTSGIESSFIGEVNKKCERLDSRSRRDSKTSPVSQDPVSPSVLRKKRKKKKRACVEPVDLDDRYAAPFPGRQSDSEEESFVHREEINNRPTNVMKTELLSLQRIQSPLMPHNSHPLHLKSFPFEALADPRAVSSPTSTLNISSTCPEDEHQCINSISSVNKGQLETDIGEFSSQAANFRNTSENQIRIRKLLDLKPNYFFTETENASSQSKVCIEDILFFKKASDGQEISPTEVSASRTSCTEPENTDPTTECQTITSEVLNKQCTVGSHAEESLNAKRRSLYSSEKTKDLECCSEEKTLRSFQDTLPKVKSCRVMDIPLPQIQPPSLSVPTDIKNPANSGNMSVTPQHRGPTQTSKDEDVLPVSESLKNKSDTKEDLSSSKTLSQNLSEIPDVWKELPGEDSELLNTSSSVGKDPKADNQIPSSVFAISSFWSEMEKLTINDILRLRLVGQAQHPSVLTQAEERNMVDPADAADSGYFTQADDSSLKPDRLSGDMSFISDLDDDLALLQSQSIKQQEDSCELPSFTGVTWENDSDPLAMDPELAFPKHLYEAEDQQQFRKMCKNVSVQNLQALDAQPLRMLRNSSLCSLHSETDEDLADPFYHLTTSSLNRRSAEEDVESSGVTFSEILQYFFGDNKSERCVSRAESAPALFLEGAETTLPEMYEHFFSEFDSGILFPFIEESKSKDQTVPLFSCTRSTNRQVQFPDAYDYFFPDSPAQSDEDEENDTIPIIMETRYDQAVSCSDSLALPDMYEHFYSEDIQGNFLWTNPLSLRKRSGCVVAVDTSSCWDLSPVKSSDKGWKHVAHYQESLLWNLENRILQQLAGQQKTCMEMQTIVADPRLDAPFLPLRQADMCLVCIAFASWVLKSSGSGGDAWKAALLANVSALSAIRYLRRHKREEASGKSPLRQIKSA